MTTTTRSRKPASKKRRAKKRGTWRLWLALTASLLLFGMILQTPFEQERIAIDSALDSSNLQVRHTEESVGWADTTLVEIHKPSNR